MNFVTQEDIDARTTYDRPETKNTRVKKKRCFFCVYREAIVGALGDRDEQQRELDYYNEPKNSVPTRSTSAAAAKSAAVEQKWLAAAKRGTSTRSAASDTPTRAGKRASTTAAAGAASSSPTTTTPTAAAKVVNADKAAAKVNSAATPPTSKPTTAPSKPTGTPIANKKRGNLLGGFLKLKATQLVGTNGGAIELDGDALVVFVDASTIVVPLIEQHLRNVKEYHRNNNITQLMTNITITAKNLLDSIDTTFSAKKKLFRIVADARRHEHRDLDDADDAKAATTRNRLVGDFHEATAALHGLMMQKIDDTTQAKMTKSVRARRRF